MAPSPSPRFTPLPHDYPYYRRAWNRVVAALLAVSFIPLILIAGGMYFYSASAMRKEILESLALVATSHKKGIDRFLQERVGQLRIAAESLAQLPPADIDHPAAWDQALAALHARMPAFTDLGVIDDTGRHLAYHGPFDLLQHNYKDAFWFGPAFAGDAYVSSAYLGFRNFPHFIITVRRDLAGRDCVVRGTVDAAMFNGLVTTVPGIDSDAYLIDSEGVFQSAPRKNGELMGQSPLGRQERFSGVSIRERGHQILALTWMTEAPWLCVVQMNRGEVFERLLKVRNVGIIVFLTGAILIGLTILLTTNYLVSLLESKRQSIRLLDNQLRRFGQLTASAQLAGRMAALMSGPLKIMADVMKADREGAGPDRAPFPPPDAIPSQLAVLQKLLADFQSGIRPVDPTPIISEVAADHLLEEVLETIIGGFYSDSITLLREPTVDLPTVRTDEGQLRSVLQTLLLNAVRRAGSGGTVEVMTRARPYGVEIAYRAGSGGQARERDLDLPAATGLGITVCEAILEKLAGTLKVDDEPGRPAEYIVHVPYRPEFLG